MALIVDVFEDGYQLSVLALQSYYQVYQYDHINDLSLRARPLWANQQFICKNIIWLNRELGEIGFAGISACRVLKLTDISHLEITNTLPAKGPGSTELVAVLNSENDKIIHKKDIFFERGASFDDHEVELIKKFTHLKILISSGGYDC